MKAVYFCKAITKDKSGKRHEKITRFESGHAAKAHAGRILKYCKGSQVLVWGNSSTPTPGYIFKSRYGKIVVNVKSQD